MDHEWKDSLGVDNGLIKEQALYLMAVLVIFWMLPDYFALSVSLHSSSICQSQEKRAGQ